MFVFMRYVFVVSCFLCLYVCVCTFLYFVFVFVYRVIFAVVTQVFAYFW